MNRLVSAQDTIDSAVSSYGISYGSKLLLAVSGGADSVALLDTIVRLAPVYSWTVRVGHVNHGLRAHESNADEEFVRQLAREYGLYIEVARFDVAAVAAETRQSLESAARELRYRALQTWLLKWPGDGIVTAHTRDDQVETVLLRLLRGSGLIGLGGMQLHGRIMRPLLTVDRTTVRRLIEERHLAFREDSSNKDRRFRRNALRLDVMPAINALEPSASRSIARAAEQLQGDASYILNEAERALLSLHPESGPGMLTVSRHTWLVLHPVLRHYVLRQMLHEVLGSLQDVDARHIAAIEQALMAGTSLLGRLPHVLHVTCTDSHFTMRIGKPPAGTSPASLSLPVPGAVRFGPWTVHSEERFERHVGEYMLAVRGTFHALLDRDTVTGGLLVRPRLPGDRIHPPGITGSRKVQDIMVDAKIPAPTRDTLPLVIFDGQVIWFPGGPMDRRYAATGASKRLLHLFVNPADQGP